MAVSFNPLMAMTVAFILAALLCPPFIALARRAQFGQQIREDGPAAHAGKAGTPTMGGIVIILSATAGMLAPGGLSPPLLVALVPVFGCGLIGFSDDYIKIGRNRSLGLKARSKIGGEFFITLLFLFLLWRLDFYSPEITVPFSGIILNLGYFYPLFVFVVLSAASNSVNLTDGIDGLAAGASLIALAAFAFLAHLGGRIELVFFCLALGGASLGFLLYNRNPARLFMGDVGSLGLGGSLAAAAVLLKAELFLILIGGVFVLETASVIIQVAVFRLTGRRVFRMSPLHHHFELQGWSERKVAAVFWLAGLLFAGLGILEYGRLVAI